MTTTTDEAPKKVQPVSDKPIDSAQVPSSDARRCNGEASIGYSRTVESDNDTLHGSLPPAESSNGTATPATSDEAKHNVFKSSINQAISDWGPWKRWNRYRRDRKEEEAEPAFWLKRDQEENTRGRLPDNERVQVPVIWVAELYTPSSVAGLFDGITDLGWEYGRSRCDDSLPKWMSDVRQGRRAGWTSLGLVTPPDDTNLMRERMAPLPEGIRSSRPILMSLTPSVTALIVAFLLTDESADQLDSPLRANYSTHITRDPRFRHLDVVRYMLKNRSGSLWRRIHRPDNLRHDAAKSRICAMESACVNWVRQYLPGSFASLQNVSFPTAVLFVTEETPPLSEGARAVRAFNALSINRDYDAWDSSEWPGGRLVLPRSWDDEGSRLVFACRRRDAFPDRVGYSEPTSNMTIAHRADVLVNGLLSRWALSCMLDGYHQTISTLRDRAAGERAYRPVRDLKELRALTRTALYDIVTSAQEVEEFVAVADAYRHDIMEMKYVRPIRGEHPDFLGELMSSQLNRARQIQRESALLQSTLSVSTDVSQTISNIRVQRVVVLLTIVSIAIAMWAVFLALTAKP